MSNIAQQSSYVPVGIEFEVLCGMLTHDGWSGYVESEHNWWTCAATCVRRLLRNSANVRSVVDSDVNKCRTILSLIVSGVLGVLTCLLSISIGLSMLIWWHCIWHASSRWVQDVKYRGPSKWNTIIRTHGIWMLYQYFTQCWTNICLPYPPERIRWETHTRILICNRLSHMFVFSCEQIVWSKSGFL